MATTTALNVVIPLVTGLAGGAFVSVYLSKDSELIALNARATQSYLTSG